MADWRLRELRERVFDAAQAVLGDLPAGQDPAAAVASVVSALVGQEHLASAAAPSLGRVDAAAVIAALAGIAQLHSRVGGVCGTCVVTETVRNRGGRRQVQSAAVWPCGTRRAVDGLLAELAAVYGPAAVPPPATQDR